MKNPNITNPGRLLAVLALLSLATAAKAFDTTWIGNFGDWDDPLNWSNGVPNNGVDNFDAFVPGGFVTINSPVTIDNLGIGGSGGSTYLWVDNADLTVLQTTTPALAGGAIRALAGTASSTVDLGTLAGFSANTLDSLSLAAVDSGFSAAIQWQGAQIDVIGSGVDVSLTGANSFIRNSLDSSDALAGLHTNHGMFQLRNRDFTTAGDFSNPGYLAVYAWTNDTTVTIDGVLAQNTGGVLVDGAIKAAGSGGFAGILEWEGAEIHTIGSDAGITLEGTGGVIRNSLDSSDALAGLHTNEGYFDIVDRDFTTAGDFSNSGSLSIWFATMSINGTLAQNTGGVLTAGEIMVTSSGSPAALEWEGAEIHTIGAGASVRLESTDSVIRNSLDASDALAGLHTNEGSFVIGGRDFTTAGDFSNEGYLHVVASWNAGASLVINGTLAQNAGGVLAEGSIELFSYNGFQAILEWEGAEIHTIGGNASVVLAGTDSIIRNGLDASDALAGLHTNEGTFQIYDRDFSTAGGFSNTGYLDAYAWNADTTLTISGALAQNAGGILSAGWLQAFAGDGFSGIIEWEGAGIHTIAEGASVVLDGAGAGIRNSLTDGDALAGLHTNEGSFWISSRDFTTAGDFTNTGSLIVEDGELATSAGGNFFLDSTSSVTIGISDAMDFGAINAEGLVTLDGDFSVSLWSLSGDPLSVIDPLDSFVVITGSGITGAFDNIASGERLIVDGGEYSFLFTVTEDSVLLSDFAAIPEPGVASLLALGGIMACLRRRGRAFSRPSRT